MKIINQSYEILSLPSGLLAGIESAGRTCYKSEKKIGCTVKGILPDKQNCQHYSTAKSCNQLTCSSHSSFGFVERLLARGHHAMIEFGDITVRFITDRGVTHEIARHRLCSFAQESTRYVRYDGNMEFIRPAWIKAQGYKGAEKALPINKWKRAMMRAEQTYLDLLDLGWSPEKARSVLPNSLKTEIVVKANVREWRHIFTLRCSKKAHPQMRKLMLPLLEELNKKVPALFGDLYETFFRS